MRFHCFYITDSDEYAALKKRINAIVDPKKRNGELVRLSMLSLGREPSSCMKAAMVEAEEWWEGQLRGIIRLSNGDEYLHIAIFDMETTPPTLVHCSCQLDSLVKLGAAMPPLYMNEYGSVLRLNGAFVLRSESEPEAFKFDYKTYAGDFATHTILSNFHTP